MTRGCIKLSPSNPGLLISSHWGVKAWLSLCLRNLTLFLGLYSADRVVIGQVREQERLVRFTLGKKNKCEKVTTELGLDSEDLEWNRRIW